MPAGISTLAPPTDKGRYNFDGEDPPAFTILQKDGLECALPLLNGIEDDETVDSRITKMENAKNELYSRKRISRSNDHLVLASLQTNQVNPLRRKQYSKSHDNLGEKEKCQNGKHSVTLSTEDFNEVLNAKLKRIQELEDGELSGKGSRKSHIYLHKKPFITTVKTGEFLMPPPEVAALLGIASYGNEGDEIDSQPFRPRLKPLVSLSKRPEVRHTSHNARCPAALKATIDFSLGMMNASTLAASALEERPVRVKTTEPTDRLPMPRVLPKKLEPIKGPMSILAKIRGDQSMFGNIMFDRRVIRGSNFANAPSLIDNEQSIAARQAEARRRHMARKRAQALNGRSIMRPGSPPRFVKRKDEPVQTEPYLEELFEKPTELEVSTQTDYYLETPPSPKFVPTKMGEDACTQIEPGDLFHFDTEVQPILEILVGKTIDQALNEVLEEEEMAAIREQRRRFQELRAAEVAELKRLKEEDRKINDERLRIHREHAELVKEQEENEQQVAEAVLLTGYIADLLPAAVENLKMSEALMKNIRTDVEGEFMPWLMKEVKKEIGVVVESREILMEIIREILENRAEAYRRLEEDDAGKDGSVGEAEEEANESENNFQDSERSPTENTENNEAST